jgi:hypothetical protein
MEKSVRVVLCIEKAEAAHRTELPAQAQGTHPFTTFHLLFVKYPQFSRLAGGNSPQKAHVVRLT